MPEVTNTGLYNKAVKNNNKEQRAYLLFENLKLCALAIRRNTVLFIQIMKVVKDDELFAEHPFDSPSFEIFCLLPEININIKFATVQRYIKIIEDLQEKGIEAKKLYGTSMSNLSVLRLAKSPKKYLETAKEMPARDFRDLIYEKELDIKVDDNIERYVRRICPFWSEGKCIKEK